MQTRADADADAFRYNSRRSCVMVPLASADNGHRGRGMVASSQHAASQCGAEILRRGGNAMDAAVAVMAALGVAEPASTGIGGDCFMLHYDAASGMVRTVCGHGKSPRGIDDELVRRIRSAPMSWHADSVHTVTVPGAFSAWELGKQVFGSAKLTMEDVLAPAIELAENGVCVGPITAHFWQKASSRLDARKSSGCESFLPAPHAGQVIYNHALARSYRMLAEQGGAALYHGGALAHAVVDELQKFGSRMTLQDLHEHEAEIGDPVATEYRGVTVHQVLPPTQGVAVLMALDALQHVLSGNEMRELGRMHPVVLESMIECVRSALVDTYAHVGDDQNAPVSDGSTRGSQAELLSTSFAQRRASEIKERLARAAVDDQSRPHTADIPPPSDTVQFCVVDRFGNAVSGVNSVFHEFGSAIVPRNAGFALQNRGLGFKLDATHVNALAGGKRPFHTIIPGILTTVSPSSGKRELLAAFGNMGGFIQAQGHTQLVVNLVDYAMDAQSAVDYPRFCLGDVFNPSDLDMIHLEAGMDSHAARTLSARHARLDSKVDGVRRYVFGRAQCIAVRNGVLQGGSDGRSDGAVCIE